MDETLRFVMHYGYAVLAVWVFAEQLGLPLPATPLLLAAGALAGRGDLKLAWVLLFCVVSSLVADVIWYEIGKRRGSSVLNLLCRISLEPDSCVRNTENLFAGKGPKALVLAKFVPGLNTAAPPMAGMFGMSLRRFLLFDGAGALIWSGLFVALGYAFSRQLELVADVALRLGTWLLVLLLGSLATYITWKYIQRQRFLHKLRITRITPEELNRKIEAGEDIAIVDLRHMIDFQADPETIPGALYLPSEEFESRYQEVPRDREIILYCT